MADALSKLRDGRAAPKRSRGTLSDLRDMIASAAQGYWDRQGRMAREGLAMADHGAQAVRGGDLSGMAGMVLGPASYLASPVSALVPTDAEVYGANIPEWAKPGIAGGLATAATFLPGPKGKNLGKGLGELTAEDAAEVEKIRARMRMFEDAAPVKQMTPERAAQLAAEAAAERAKNPPRKYEVPPMEDFLPRKGLGKGLDKLTAEEANAPRPTLKRK